MQQVGDAATSVPARQKAPGRLLHAVRDRGVGSCLEPALAQRGDPAELRFPHGEVVLRRAQALQVFAEQFGGQRGAHASGVTGRIERRQQALDLDRLGTGVDALGAHVVAGDVPLRQLARGGFGLAVAVHEHGDAWQVLALVARLRKQIANLATDFGQHAIGERADGPWPRLSFCIRLVGQAPDRQRRLAGQPVPRRVLGRREAGRFECDEIDQERIIDAVEHAVGRRYQRRIRSPVLAQRMSIGAGVARRRVVGMDVATAEAVDGLLRIADQEQHRIGSRLVDASQDRVLLRIGVLELVDQQGGDLLGNAQRNALAAGSVQFIVQLADKIVIAEPALPLAIGRQSCPDETDRSAVEACQQGIVQFIAGAQQGFHAGRDLGQRGRQRPARFARLCGNLALDRSRTQCRERSEFDMARITRAGRCTAGD